MLQAIRVFRLRFPEVAHRHFILIRPMTTPEERRAANDLRVAEDIRRYGCHIVSVFEPEERHPPFSYSIGIQETTSCPEAIVIGLSHKLGASMINEYLGQLRRGVRFVRGTPYEGFLEGFRIYVEPAKASGLTEYTLGCDRYYKGEKYAVVQLVWPSTAGVWPWQRWASEWLQHNQPMLGRKRPDRT